jgi:hypothetical protein
VSRREAKNPLFPLLRQDKSRFFPARRRDDAALPTQESGRAAVSEDRTSTPVAEPVLLPQPFLRMPVEADQPSFGEPLPFYPQHFLNSQTSRAPPILL